MSDILRKSHFLGARPSFCLALHGHSANFSEHPALLRWLIAQNLIKMKRIHLFLALLPFVFLVNSCCASKSVAAPPAPTYQTPVR